jgi:(2Fe-2S) ferredoxin
MSNETYFQLEGEFLGVCALDGYKLKYLRLRTADAPAVLVKIPKELRGGMVYKLAIGDLLRCEGIQKDLKFKAYSIEKIDRVASPAEHRSEKSTPLAPVTNYPANQSKVKILICQKSHCLNHGGREVYSALTEQLSSHNLNDSVSVQATGCLKCCKQAPNLVVLPDRSSYHNVRTSQISAIISKVRYSLAIEPK